eukprot:TRINITY_DN2254_c0_g1_i1.p1 TRINITY_DN2254_c0_g1~~TRINITY_DN2254_c0_g1_i1.p1  ORF type:complete len:835 (+),score=233.69 TRINITY_DN2254_c0_g1_i1:121-2625(+)
MIMMEGGERVKREMTPLNEEERTLIKECRQFFVDILNKHPLSTHYSKGESVKGDDELHRQEAMRITLERFEARLKASINISEEYVHSSLTNKYKEWKREQMEKMPAPLGEEVHKKKERAPRGRGGRRGGGAGRGRGRGGGKRLGMKRERGVDGEPAGLPQLLPNEAYFFLCYTDKTDGLRIVDFSCPKDWTVSHLLGHLPPIVVSNEKYVPVHVYFVGQKNNFLLLPEDVPLGEIVCVNDRLLLASDHSPGITPNKEFALSDPNSASLPQIPLLSKKTRIIRLYEHANGLLDDSEPAEDDGKDDDAQSKMDIEATTKELSTSTSTASATNAVSSQKRAAGDHEELTDSVFSIDHKDSWCCLVVSRSEDEVSATKFSRSLCQLIQESEMARRKRKHPSLNASTFSWRYLHHRDVIADDLVIPYDACFPAFVSASLEAISQKESVYDAITSCAKEMDIRKLQIGILSRLRRLEDLKGRPDRYLFGIAEALSDGVSRLDPSQMKRSIHIIPQPMNASKATASPYELRFHATQEAFFFITLGEDDTWFGTLLFRTSALHDDKLQKLSSLSLPPALESQREIRFEETGLVDCMAARVYLENVLRRTKCGDVHFFHSPRRMGGAEGCEWDASLPFLGTFDLFTSTLFPTFVSTSANARDIYPEAVVSSKLKDGSLRYYYLPSRPVRLAALVDLSCYDVSVMERASAIGLGKGFGYEPGRSYKPHGADPKKSIHDCLIAIQVGQAPLRNIDPELVVKWACNMVACRRKATFICFLPLSCDVTAERTLSALSAKRTLNGKFNKVVPDSVHVGILRRRPATSGGVQIVRGFLVVEFATTPTDA